MYGKINIYKWDNYNSDAPIPYYSPSCELKEFYGTELYKQQELQMKNTIIFKTRICNKLKDILFVKDDYVVIYKNYRFNIFQMDFSKNCDYILLKCERIL